MRTIEELQEQLDDVKWQREAYQKYLDEKSPDRRARKAVMEWLSVLDDRERIIYKHLQWIQNCEHLNWEEMIDGARVCLDCGRIS
jgi:hypothetical protein